MKKNSRDELWKARNFGVGECIKEVETLNNRGKRVFKTNIVRAI
jgi:hypothetical protein